jgi:hypothetical protein
MSDRARIIVLTSAISVVLGGILLYWLEGTSSFQSRAATPSLLGLIIAWFLWSLMMAVLIIAGTIFTQQSGRNINLSTWDALVLFTIQVILIVAGLGLIALLLEPRNTIATVSAS